MIIDFALITGKLAGLIWSNGLIYLALGAGIEPFPSNNNFTMSLISLT